MINKSNALALTLSLRAFPCKVFSGVALMAFKWAAIWAEGVTAATFAFGGRARAFATLTLAFGNSNKSFSNFNITQGSKVVARWAWRRTFALSFAFAFALALDKSPDCSHGFPHEITPG